MIAGKEALVKTSRIVRRIHMEDEIIGKIDVEAIETINLVKVNSTLKENAKKIERRSMYIVIVVDSVCVPRIKTNQLTLLEVAVVIDQKKKAVIDLAIDLRIANEIETVEKIVIATETIEVMNVTEDVIVDEIARNSHLTIVIAVSVKIENLAPPANQALVINVEIEAFSISWLKIG